MRESPATIESSWLLTVAVTTVCLSICLHASPSRAQNASRLIAFGTSYIDSGNFTTSSDPELRSVAPSAQPYYEGRWTNGPNWADQVNLCLFGAVLKPSNAGGTNYAFGGATTGIPKLKTFPQTVPTILEQVETHLADVKGAVDPEAIYVIQGAGNDGDANAQAGSPKSPAQIAQTAAQNQIVAAKLLLDAGAKKIVIASTGKVGSYMKELPAGVTFVDLSKLHEELIPNAKDLGISDSSRSCVIADYSKRDWSQNLMTYADGGGASIPGVCSNPDDHVFFDGDHPTSRFQRAIAVNILNAIGFRGAVLDSSSDVICPAVKR